MQDLIQAGQNWGDQNEQFLTHAEWDEQKGWKGNLDAKIKHCLQLCKLGLLKLPKLIDLEPSSNCLGESPASDCMAESIAAKGITYILIIWKKVN